MSNSSSIHVTDITVGDDAPVSPLPDPLMVDDSNDLSIQTPHQTIEYHHPQTNQSALHIPNIVASSSHIYSSSPATSNMHIISGSNHSTMSTASQPSQSLVQVSNGGVQVQPNVIVPNTTVDLGARHAASTSISSPGAPSVSYGSPNQVYICCNTQLDKDAFVAHYTNHHQSSNVVQAKLVDDKLGNSQVMQVVMPSGDAQKGRVYQTMTNSADQEPIYSDGSVVQYHSSAKNQDQIYQKISTATLPPGSICHNKILNNMASSNIRATPKSSNHEEPTMMINNKGTYIIAASDLNQLQRSGGQLLLQQQPQSQQQEHIALQDLREQVIVNNPSNPHSSIVQHNLSAKDLKNQNISFININDAPSVLQTNTEVTMTSVPSQGSAAQLIQTQKANVQLRTFNNQPSEHQESVRNRPFKCDQCTASFLEESECEEHKRKHSDDGPFTCEDCHFSFMYKSHFRSHKTRCEKKRAMAPQKPKTVNFNVIKRAFPTHETVSESNNKTNSNKRRCTTVNNNKAISHQSQSNIQVAVKGDSDQTYYLPTNEIDLKPHFVQATSSKFNTSNIVYSSPGKRSVNPINIKNTNINDFETFNPSKPSFKRLKKQNNEMRPFECNECDASFTNTDDLDAHKSKHSADGPFRCDGCQFLYLYRKLYDAHKRKCKKGKSKEDGPVHSNAKQTVMYVANNNGQNVQQQQQQQQPQQIHIQQEQPAHEQHQIISSLQQNLGQHHQQVIYLDKNNQPITTANTTVASNLQQIDLSQLNSQGSNLNLLISNQNSNQAEIQSNAMGQQTQQIQIISPNGGVQILDGNILEVRGQQYVTVGGAGVNNLGGVSRNNEIKYEILQASNSVVDNRQVMGIMKKD